MVNKVYCDLTKYNQHELQNMSPFDLRPSDMIKEDLDSFFGKYSGNDSNDADKFLHETVFVTKTGEQVPVELNVHFLQVEDYRIGFAIIRDISKRKKLENQMAAYLKKEELLLKNERDLRKQLERQVSDISQFIRAVVHEIKTPLTPIKAAAGELESQYADANQMALIKQISSGCERINKRTSELCDVFKGELGILKLDRRHTHIENILNEIYMLWNEEAKFNRVSFTRCWEEDLPSLNIDIERTREVIDNILSNAFKATPIGGTVTMNVSVHGDEMVTTISDTGSGIKKDQLPKIFEAYYSNRPDGLGLGLYLSKLVVTLHGGKIWIDKTSHKGTTVKFTLPIATDNV